MQRLCGDRSVMVAALGSTRRYSTVARPCAWRAPPINRTTAALLDDLNSRRRLRGLRGAVLPPVPCKSRRHAASSSSSPVGATHRGHYVNASSEQSLLVFFDKMDADAIGHVAFEELEAGLDLLASKIPCCYALVHAIKTSLVGSKGTLVRRSNWIRVSEDAVSKIIPPDTSIDDVRDTIPKAHGQQGVSKSVFFTFAADLSRAIENLDPDLLRRRAQQRALFGNSLASPVLVEPRRWSRYDEANPSSESLSPRTPEAIRKAHKDILMRFFERLDIDSDSSVRHDELEVGLDTLFSTAPSYYQMTSCLLVAIGEEADAAVHRMDWSRACDEALNQMLDNALLDDQMGAMLAELHKATDELDPGRVRRRARRRMIYGRSLNVPMLGEEEFPKKRIDGTSSKQLDKAGLHRFEACLEGYSFVDATFGAGSFAQVFLVRNDATGDLQAMKRIDRQRMQKTSGLSEQDVVRRVEHEFRHLQHSNHPHIIKLYEFRQDARYSYFVMEAANGGDLRQVVNAAYGKVKRGGKLVQKRIEHPRKLSESYVAVILEQAAYALHDLHREGRIHKDVKLENLMLLSGEGPPHLVLIDLGFMEMVPEREEEEGLMPAGTPHTMAPEVMETFLCKRPSAFDERCDIFSLGVVIFEMLTGRPPFEPVVKGAQGHENKLDQIDFEATLQAIRSVNLQAELNSHSEGVLDLLSKMMNLDPEQRPTALECLRHPWLVRQGERRRARRTSAGSPKHLEASGVPSTSDAGSIQHKARRRSIEQQARTFARRSALQRAAAYHLAAQMPVNRLREAADGLEQVEHVLGEQIDREALARTLEDVLGVEEACARYVAATVDAENAIPEDFCDFAQACAALCFEREQMLAKFVIGALDAAGSRGLTLVEALGALERGNFGRLQRHDVVEWLKIALDTEDSDSTLKKLSREAMEKHFKFKGTHRSGVARSLNMAT